MDLVSNCSKTDDNYQNYIDSATSFVKQHGRLFKWIFETFLTLCISAFVIYSLAYDFHENVVVLILALLLCSGLAIYGIYCKFGGQLQSLYRSKVKQLTDRSVRMLYWLVWGAIILGLGVFITVDVALSNPGYVRSLAGLICLAGVCFLGSKLPHKVSFHIILSGICCQLILAILLLRWDTGYTAVSWLSDQLTAFISYSDYGALFVYGPTFTEHAFAFQVTSNMIFFGAVVSLLQYWGVLHFIVGCVGMVLSTVMGLSAAEAFQAVSNIFLGPNSSILMIRSMLSDMTNSELHTLLVCGMATIGGGMIPLFVSMGISSTQLVSASFISAPASLLAAKTMFPDSDPTIRRKKIYYSKMECHNSIQAFSDGASNMVRVCAEMLAALIATLAGLEFVNTTLTWFGDRVGSSEEITLEWMCSYLLMPVTFAMGVTWSDCHEVARLIGVKTILNEVIAYSELSILIDNRLNGTTPAISLRSEAIATYALCGYSNIGTIGMLVGFLSALVPHRIGDITSMAGRALVASTIACLMTATVAGLLYQEELST